MNNFRRRRVQQKSKWPLVLVVIFVFFLVFNNLNRNLWMDSDLERDELVSFTIAKGTSGKAVAQQLEDADIITSKLFFRLKARKTDPIQAGTFQLPSKASIPTVLSIITKPADSLKITIPEGFTIKQIDERLAAQNLTSSGEFIKCVQTCPLPEAFQYKNFFSNQSPRNLEGFLFPNTYFIDSGSFTSQEFLGQLLLEFQDQVADIAQTNNSGHNLYEVITMASIVEKEVRTDPDMPIVAGLLWKRLDSGWPIGADATLLYQKDNREITFADLNADNPYNTRKFQGLPPTPINNPGLSTIKAALNPKSSPYWFYLTPPSGEVIYGRTNEEHNANKRKYL